MKVNKELDRLEKMVDAYLRQAERDWKSYEGNDEDFGRLQAYKAVLFDIRLLKEEE